MNLVQLRQRLSEIMARLTEIRGLESSTDEIRTETGTLLEEARGIREQIAQAEELESAVTAYDQARSTSRGRISAGDSIGAEREAETRTEREETRSLGEALTDNDDYRAFADRRSNGEFELRFEGDEYRTLVSTATLPTGYLQEQRLPGFRREDPLYGTLRDVLLVGTTTAESLRFFIESAYTNNAAFVGEATATTGSSGLKNESALAFTTGTAEVGTIAHWMAITEQLTWNAPELRSIVDQRLLEGLNQEEDTQLLSGDGSGVTPVGLLETPNIQVLDNAYFTTNPTQNSSTDAEPFDRLARAKRVIRDVGRARPNFIVMNPEDEEYFQTVMDGNDHYYGGGPYANGVATTFWGLPRIVNENMPQGQALVGDGRHAQIWDRMSARLVVGWVNDQLIRNMKTVLAEKRVGLAVYRPTAFALVDLFA